VWLAEALDIEAWTFFYTLTESEVSAIESQYLRSAWLKHVRIPLEMHDFLQGLVRLWVNLRKSLYFRLLLQCVYFAIDVNIVNAQGSNFYYLSDVPTASWCVALIWAPLLIPVNELAKMREIKWVKIWLNNWCLSFWTFWNVILLHLCRGLSFVIDWFFW
jgi:hypothetical protein